MNNEYIINCGGTLFPVFKNPSDDQYFELVDRFKAEYPMIASITGEPKTRQTFDTEGNIYMWVSADAMHYTVEGYLKKQGIICNQNKYFDDMN